MEQTTEKKVLLDCRDVSLGYEGKAIWEGLTFQVRSGDYLWSCLLYTSPSPRDRQ